jgi:large subunit ribosomal protein L24
MATRSKLLNLVNKALERRKPSPQLREAAKKKRWDILEGDKVQVIGVHPEKGKQGIVKTVFRTRDRVTVTGVNMKNKFIKGDEAQGLKGQTIVVERTLHYSKVNLVDPATGKPTRVYRKILEDGTKVRVAKKSGAIIPYPIKDPPPPPSDIITDKDTVDADVWEITYGM